MDIQDTHALYDAKRYAWRQVADTVEGTSAIKRANEVYLPMPSGMVGAVSGPSSDLNQPQAQFVDTHNDFQHQYLPWWHNNPAYRAYLQRARFPDMTANTLRGLIGLATKQQPELKLPSGLEYLEEIATPSGMNIYELYSHCISEVLQFGKISLCADARGDEIYILPYNALKNTNWDSAVIKGLKRQTESTFLDYQSENHEEYIKYLLDPDGIVIYEKYKDAKLFTTDPITFKGKTLTELPIVNIGSITNNAEPDIVPLLGISDVALTIYRKDADLSQAQFLTCNPTLFLFGADSVPKVVGSSVIVNVENPDARAEYPSTDTSALEHIRTTISDLFNEAIMYGSSLLGGTKKQAEAAEALRLRQASYGATLVHTVNQVSKGLTNILNFIDKWRGGSGVNAFFDASTEFAETTLTSHEINSLVTSWIQGGISHDTFLDNMRDAGFIDSEVTNIEEKTRIANESPLLDVIEENDNARNER